MNPSQADQRHLYYQVESQRTGINPAILSALYQVHRSPLLADGETGLGLLPINQITQEQLDSFPEQVQFASNTIRAITDRLIEQGWKNTEIWDQQNNRYTDHFVVTLASGYLPPISETNTAYLEPCDPEALLEVYEQILNTSVKEVEERDANEDSDPTVTLSTSQLDQALLSLVERIPVHYQGLPHQQSALIELVRLWRQLENRQAVLQSLVNRTLLNADSLSNADLDRLLLDFTTRVSANYSGFPYQREALINMTQLWRRLSTREETLISLQNSSNPETSLDIYDPALIAFTQRIPNFYQRSGSQRHALTESVRLWYNVETRSNAISQLGIDGKMLTNPANDPLQIKEISEQIDNKLLEFIKAVPQTYQETDNQRNALIRLVQLWRNQKNREETLKSLKQDLDRIADPKQPDRVVIIPLTTPPRPDRWTPQNIQLAATIIPNGTFTWAEATHGGTRMPPNQKIVDAIVRLAKTAQKVREHLDRPMIVTSWYRPPEINKAVGGAKYSRHMVGDAMDFICEGISGNQLYWTLDPWYKGGLGRYQKFPHLCHIDARGYRARWLH